MTRTDLALLLSPLPLAPLFLALAACGGEQGERRDRREGSPAPLGFELAMVGTADAAVARAPSAAPVVALTPEQLAARLASGNVRLIDVRTAEEVAEGTIPGAEHMALASFDPAALDREDGREIVLYCRSGNRSALAGEKLASATRTPVHHLGGGILAWKEAGQPVERTR